MRIRAAFITNSPELIDRVYPESVRQRLNELLDLLPGVLTEETLAARAEEVKDVRVLLSTWGIPALTQQRIAEIFPNLQVLFYGAGSVQAFARPFLARGVRVFSAWAANAVPVAEYTVSQIVLSGKGCFQAMRRYRDHDRDDAKRFVASQPCNYRIRVGLLGAGMIGRMVAERLRAYEYEVLIYDPFVSDETLAALGARRATLEEIFSTCQIISNHVANLPSTVGMIDEKLLRSMLPNATFINTGRGAQVDEAALARAMEECPDRTALLDVTFPEPPDADSPLLRLPNVFLTPHIAGSMGREVARMGAYMADECARILSGEAPRYEVTPAMLETMA